MNSEKSLESFSRFAKEQYKTETKVWVYLFFILSVIFGVLIFNTSLYFFAPMGVLNEYSLFLSALVHAVGMFLFLYGLHLVCLFIWYFIIFWLLRWFPVIRKEKFSSNHD